MVNTSHIPTIPNAKDSPVNSMSVLNVGLNTGLMKHTQRKIDSISVPRSLPAAYCLQNHMKSMIKSAPIIY